MRAVRLRTSLVVVGALAVGAAMAGCDANAAGARQAGPSKAMIEKLIAGNTGGETQDNRFQFTDIEVAPPRVLKYGDVYGLKEGTRVWLVRSSYVVFGAAGDVTASWSTCDRTENVQYYYLYKDEFGKWAAYATSHPGSVTRNTYHGACPNMPGVGVFSTPLPTGQ